MTTNASNEVIVMFSEGAQLTYGDIIEVFSRYGYDLSKCKTMSVDKIFNIVVPHEDKESAIQFIDDSLNLITYCDDDDDYNKLKYLSISSSDPELFNTISYYISNYALKKSSNTEDTLYDVGVIVEDHENRLATLEAAINMNCIQHVKELTDMMIEMLKSSGYKFDENILKKQFPTKH